MEGSVPRGPAALDPGALMKTEGGAHVQEVGAEYEIRNFEAALSMADACEVVSEPVLAAGNYRFGIRVTWTRQTKGRTVDRTKDLGLWVQRLDSGDDVCSIWLKGMTLVNRDPNMSMHHFGKGWKRVETLDSNGWPDFRGTLPFEEVVQPSNGWLHDSSLVVRATLCVAVGRVGDRPPAVAEEHGSAQEVCDGLHNLLECAELCDVTIKVGEEHLRAHSQILAARSPFFKAAFSCPLKESKDREIKIEDLEAPAVRALVHYLYTGSVDTALLASDESAVAVLQAAHRFEVRGLVQRCTQALASRFEVDTVCDRLLMAELIGHAHFKAQCLAFIRPRLGEVQATEAFSRLAERRPALLRDILETVQPPVKRRRIEGANGASSE